MKRLTDPSGLLIVLFLVHLATQKVVADDVAPEPVVFYDLTPIFSVNLEDENNVGGSGMRYSWP